VFVKETSNKEQVESTWHEEENTEKTVHGGIGMSIKIGKAGKSKT
jgi:hypothetical protein